MNPDDNELPEGWAWAPIAEITTKVGSGATPKGGSTAYHQRGVPFIRSMNVHFSGFDPEGLVFLDDKQAALLNEVSVQTGDVLLNITGASIGRVCQVPAHMAGARVNQHVCIIRLKTGVLATFLAGYLSSPQVQEMIWSEEYGVTRQALTKGQILAFNIPIPPLAEQRRIVAAVEAVLAKVNAARERLNRVPALLKRFRQAVLSAACSGRLTADWRGTECFDDLPEGWSRRRLDSIFEVRTGGTPDRKREEYYTDGKIPWVRTTEVQNCEIIQAEKHITQLGLENSSAKVFPPSTILVALYGEGRTRGQVAILKIAAATNQACSALINPDLSDATHRYVFHTLMADYHRLRGEAAGGNQPNLSNGLIKSWEIPFPPLAEQQEIVRRVSELFALADAIESRLSDAQRMADQLTQAVLAKAFRGELVPTEAELARRENRTYESATELLARIRAEREQPAAPTHTKPGRLHRVTQPAKPKPRRVSKTVRLHGAIAVAYFTDRQPTAAKLNRTRAIKFAEFVQWHFGIELALAPVRDEHGPYDPAIEDIEKYAEKEEYIETHEEPKGAGKFAVRYRRGGEIATTRKKAHSLFGDSLPAVNEFLDRMFALETDDVELFGTVYAAWNDLLLDKRPTDDAAIVAEVHGWHAGKRVRFPEAQVLAMIASIREWGYVPAGAAPRTLPAPASE